MGPVGPVMCVCNRAHVTNMRREYDVSFRKMMFTQQCHAFRTQDTQSYVVVLVVNAFTIDFL